MFGAHETQIYLTRWQRSPPFEVAVPGRERPVTRGALVRVVREELLPFITYGPTYQRAVADNLHRALEMFRKGWGEEFTYWLGETIEVASKVRAAAGEAYDPDRTYVLASNWSVSYNTGSHIDGAILNVHWFDDMQPNSRGGMGVVVRHPIHDGKQFPSRAVASEYAMHAGLLKRFVSRFARTASA